MEIYGIVADIKTIAVSFDVIYFQWISREKNREADMLAKQILSVTQVSLTLNSVT